MGDGGHPPGVKFHVKCVSKTELTVSFTSGKVSIDATFTEQDDADYFSVEGEYGVEFRVPGADQSDSGA